MDDVKVEVFPKELKKEMDDLINKIVDTTGANWDDVENAMKIFYNKGQLHKIAVGIDLNNLQYGKHPSDSIDSFVYAMDRFNQNKENNSFYRKDNKIMKVMISMPMNGQKESKIHDRMELLKKKFAAMHIEVIDSIIKETADPNTYNEYSPALFYIGESIKMLGQVDMLYMDDGWRSARGCQIERDVATKYGIKIIYSDFFADVKLNIEEDTDKEMDENNFKFD